MAFSSSVGVDLLLSPQPLRPERSSLQAQDFRQVSSTVQDIVKKLLDKKSGVSHELISYLNIRIVEGLAQKVLEIRISEFPKFGNPEIRKWGIREFRKSGIPEIGKSGIPKIQESGFPEFSNICNVIKNNSQIFGSVSVIRK